MQKYKLVNILKIKVLVKTSIWVFLTIFFMSCKPFYTAEYKKPMLVDKKISKPAKVLHKKLAFIPKDGIAVGQQDATCYGIGWKYNNQENVMKCDVFDIINDFPAVFGFDLGDIEHGADMNLDSVPFDDMRTLMVQAYQDGGIVTVSWHLDNPVSGGDSWDKTPAVTDILKGGSEYETYRLWVKRVADFLKSVQYEGEPIPIIFRPFHEMNGSWFWWGEGNCASLEYIRLWRETVEMLRDDYDMHNLLYVYSPNKLNPDDDYMKYYPGDAYVDILGIDIYDFYNADDYVKSIDNDLALVKQIATEKNKLYAFTETGLERVNTPQWFTEVLYPHIANSGISWILFWRNHTTSHYYMPYKTQAVEGDLIEFFHYPETLFLKQMEKYKKL